MSGFQFKGCHFSEITKLCFPTNTKRDILY
jgi:hypothetical protein